MAAAAIFNLIPVAILTHSRLSTVDLNHHTKFGANISIGGWLTVIFQNPRWWPSAILDFRKCEFWPIGSLGMLIFHHYTKYDAKILIDAQIMAQKRSSIYRPPPSWIYFWWLLSYFQSGKYFPLCTTDFNLRTKFLRQYLNPRLNYNIPDGGRPPCWIIENLPIESLGLFP